MSLSTADKMKTWSQYNAGSTQPIPTQDDQPSLFIKRLDLVESWASGNKYFKLKYVLLEALEKDVENIISKGGMFSNHLAALSSACQAFDIRLTCVVRSYQPDEDNPCIQRLRAHGDEIVYMSPEAYNAFDESSAEKLNPDALFIPEGGLSALGIQGSSEIAQECLHLNPSHVIIAGGTMSTAIGILSALPSSCQLIIMPAWKGCTSQYVQEIIDRYKVGYETSWRLWPDDHFGGFGKFNNVLVEFIKSYRRRFDIPLDPVYTGKLMYAVHQKLDSGYFKKDDRVVVVHSGGLQGLAGYQYRFPNVWKDVH